MFCPKCGTENPATSRFCKTCGTPMTAVPAPTPAPAPAPMPGPAPTPAPVPAPTPAPSASTYAIICCVAVIIATLITLMPLVRIDLGAIPELRNYMVSSGASTDLEFSPFGLVFITDLSRSVSAMVSQMGSSSSMQSEIMQLAQEFAWAIDVLRILWIAEIALSAIALWRAITSKGADLGGMLPAGIACALVALPVIVVANSLNGMVMNGITELNSYGSSIYVSGSIISASMATWVMLVLGIVAAVVSVAAAGPRQR